MKPSVGLAVALLLATPALGACGSSSPTSTGSGTIPNGRPQLVRAEKSAVTFDVPADWVVLKGWTTDLPQRAAQIAAIEAGNPKRAALAASADAYAAASSAINGDRPQVYVFKMLPAGIAKVMRGGHLIPIGGLRTQFEKPTIVIDAARALTSPIGPADSVTVHGVGGNVYIDEAVVLTRSGPIEIICSGGSAPTAEALSAAVVGTLKYV